MDKKYFVIIIIALFLMYFATTQYYNSGLSLTDLNVTKSSSNNSEYDISYMLRSVRHFDTIECHYTLFDENNDPIGDSTTSLTDITDGSYPLEEKVSVNSSSVVKSIDIKLIEITSDNDKKNIFEQVFEI